MGRGMAWTAAECADLARAWIGTSEDPIRGVEQASSLFYSTMFERFCSLAPEGANSKQYHGRQPRPVRAKWDAMAADCQKFRSAIRFIRACKPTGVSENEIVSMAIAKHLGKRATMSYDARSFPHYKWVYNQAFAVLRRIPKFRDDIAMVNHEGGAETGSVANSGLYLETEDREEVDETGEGEYSAAVALSGATSSTVKETVRDSDTVGSTEDETVHEHGGNRGGHPGRKKAKKGSQKIKLDLIAVENAKKIADAMERRVQLIEEKNALQAFSITECVTEEEKRDRAEFFRLTRSVHLKRARERIGGAAANLNHGVETTAATNSVDPSHGGTNNSSATTVPPHDVNMVQDSGGASDEVILGVSWTQTQGEQSQAHLLHDEATQTRGDETQARLLHAGATPASSLNFPGCSQ